jgi:hypothetical protein
MFICAIEVPSGSRFSNSNRAAKVVSDLSAITRIFPSGPNRGSYAYRYKGDKDTTVGGVAGADKVTKEFTFYDVHNIHLKLA